MTTERTIVTIGVVMSIDIVVVTVHAIISILDATVVMTAFDTTRIVVANIDTMTIVTTSYTG